MDAKKELGRIAPEITKYTLEAIKPEQERIKGKYPYIDEFWDKIVNIVKYGGKRLRGAFLYYSYLMHGGKNVNEALKAAALPELIQLYLLIIDDFQDKAEMRRGVDTIHKIYRDKYKGYLSNSDALHFGNSIAVLAGLEVNHLAGRFLAELDFSCKLKIKAISTINRQISDVGYGQFLDIYSGRLDKVDEEYVMNVLLLKTAKYTYEGPLHIGAILAGASDRDLENLTAYAIPAGIAFQIQDDILGMYGNEEKTGKPSDSDLIEGKRTLLIVKALEFAKKSGQDSIRKTLGNSDMSSEDADTVRKIIIDSGALDYAKQKAKELVLKAKSNLLSTNKYQGKGFKFIMGIADYMINREL